MRITNRRCDRMYRCILIRTDDTNHLDIQTIFDLIFQVISIIALIHITFL